MSFIETPRFPDELAIGGSGGPVYKTSVVSTINGDEHRNQHWEFPKQTYDIGLANRSETLTKDLFGFFYTIAQGKKNGFRFKDFLPGESSGFEEVCGTGNGVKTGFQLFKIYDYGDPIIKYARIISKPVPGTVIVYKNGVLQSAYTLDTTTGIITFTVAPPNTHIITATFDFDVPVRFDVDVIKFQRVEVSIYSWPSIPLIEVRDI
jgi:uncharacterized protein (TIGR02217 family)